MFNRLVFWLALLAACGVSAQSTLRAGAMVGPPDCRFEWPQVWASALTSPSFKWEGDCQAGLAEGLGVLRAYGAGGQRVQVFYGRLERGRLLSGVIEGPDGFQAGGFKSARLVETDNRSVLIKAFETGSAAARTASDRFKQQGNKASASHYAERAQRLAEQMD